jgi:hypothetical protein
MRNYFRQTPFWVVLFVTVAAGIGFVGLAAVAAAWEMWEGDLSREFRTRLIDFFLVVALGAVVAFIVEQVKRRTEQRERWHEYRAAAITSILNDLDSIYKRVKRTRQVLGVVPRYHPANVEELWNLRTEVEDLEALLNAVSDQRQSITEFDLIYPRIRRMDQYLGACWKEYRSWATNPSLTNELQQYESFGEQLSSFVRLHERPKPESDGDFAHFDRDYHAARQALVGSLDPRRVSGRDQPASLEGRA